MGKTLINCLIIDDERLDSLIIEENISANPSFRLVGTYTNPIESLELLNSENIDLLFLDVNMPFLNGVDFLKSLPDPPLCIFITKHPEYAVDAFDAHAIDYLLKPIKAERFQKAADRAEEYFEIRQKALQYTLRFENDFLLVKEGNQTSKVLTSEILYIEALANYTKIVTSDMKYITLANLKHFMEQLPEERFMRVHRSYAIAIDKISSLQAGEVVVQDRKIPVGKNYRQMVLQRFRSGR
jgi:DNA-binding LytR/AlgR family response regulator